MTRTRLTAIILACIVLGGGAIGFYLFWKLGNPSGSLNVDVGFVAAVLLCIFVSMLLSALPLLISYVQTTAKDRQLERLKSIQEYGVAKTAYYGIAVTTLNSIQPARVDDSDYAMPIVSFCVVVIFGCLMVFLGGFPEVEGLFQRKTFLLGGMNVLPMPASTAAELAAIAIYQKGTLLVGSFAFIGSYVYMLARLLTRINNNDIYPISYYYYVARIVTAVLVAMVLRHVAGLIVDTKETGDAQVLLLLLGFAVGFSPDLFIIALLKRAYQAVRIPGGQGDPDRTALPSNMNLLMIEGLTSDKIDRLVELDIDNAQILAEQNPFIIWPRLPYSLMLIVDWIAQAQLYRFTKEAGIKALRAKSISTIYDLHGALSDQKSAQEIAAVCGLCPTAIPAYIATLESDPSFRHLREVRNAL